jgi:hypothetical protein
MNVVVSIYGILAAVNVFPSALIVKDFGLHDSVVPSGLYPLTEIVPAKVSLV